MNGSIAASTRSCILFFGQTSNSDLECNNLEPAESHENGLNAAFDEIRIYNRALSENEIAALLL